MARFLELDVVFEHDTDTKLRDLGLEIDGEEYVEKAMIDLDDIQSLYPSLKPGDTEKVYTSIIMKGTKDVWTITLRYSLFKEIFKAHK